MLCNAFIMRLTANKFSLILKHDVAISFVPFIFLIFCMLGLYTLDTRSFFYHTKATLIRHEHQNNAPTIAVGHHHIGALTNTICLNIITNYTVNHISQHIYIHTICLTQSAIMILTQCNKSNKKKQGFKHNHKNKHNNYTTCNKSVHSKTDDKYRTKNRT